MDSPNCEPPDGKLTTRIISELADQTDTDPFSLTPIAESIDPDALETLLTGSRGSDVRVTFRHGGYQITVDSTGSLDIQPDS